MTETERKDREHYVLRVERDEDGRVNAVTVDASDMVGGERHARLNGDRGARIAGPLHDLVRSRGVTGRQWADGTPIDLDQVTGAQAELIIAAVRPLRRGDRVDAVAQSVAAMGREEASYWHAKSRARHGLRALRVLIAGGR